MNTLKSKLSAMTQVQPVPVSADEIEPGYTLFLRPLKGGELCFWREKTLDKAGSMYDSSNTEKLMLGIALSLVDQKGERLMTPEEYGTLNDLPLMVLDRLIQTFFKLNNLGVATETESETDLKNSSEATQDAS